MEHVIPERPGEALDVARLTPLLQEIFPQITSPWQVWQYASGHSNLTYLLVAGEKKMVLRRPPLGHLAPRAHDVIREAKFLKTLSSRFSGAPYVYQSYDDPTIIGAPFFLMEHRDGILVNDTWRKETLYEPNLGRQISLTLIRRLVDLHRVHWQSTDIAGWVRPAGFLVRQVVNWVKRYEAVKLTEVTGIEGFCQWLVEGVPPSGPPTLIHYDYKLNNVLFSPDYSDLVGVFDWEMATVGDPFLDLAVAASYWIEPGDPDILKKALGDSLVTQEAGFFTRRDWVEQYCRQSGLNIDHWAYYLSFAYFKLAVIVAQIYARYVQGATRDERFKHFGTATAELLEVAMNTRQGMI